MNLWSNRLATVTKSSKSFMTLQALRMSYGNPRLLTKSLEKANSVLSGEDHIILGLTQSR